MLASDALLLLIPLGCIGLLLWFNADKIYDFHRTLKKEHPLLFKIIGYNERHLDNRPAWIKHFRIFITSFVLFAFGLFLVLFLAF